MGKITTFFRGKNLKNAPIGHKRKRILCSGIVATLAILIVTAICANVDWQMVKDENTARFRSYAPSTGIAKMSDELKLTRKGKAVFYATSPSLQAGEAFNRRCSFNGVGALTLGCYYRDKHNNENIVIYDYGMQSISENGLHYIFSERAKITALHEMLHAVYDRLGVDKKEDSCRKLKTVISGIDNLNEELSHYSEQEQCTEMFARFGSEYLPELHTRTSLVGESIANSFDEAQVETFSQLTDLYDDYFDCRDASIADAYWGNENRLKQYSEKLDSYHSNLGREESRVKGLISDYYRNPTWSGYNSVNSEIDNYNEQLAYYNSLVGTYNKVQNIFDSKNSAISSL